MKHFHTLFFVLLAGAHMALLGQPIIQNGNFETWTEEKPQPWTWDTYTTKANACTKSTDAHTGNHALKIQNKAKQGFVATIQVPTTENLPAQLTGFLKYNLDEGQRAVITVTVADSLTPGTFGYEEFTVGWQSFKGSSSSYLGFSIPLDYTLNNKFYLDKKPFNFFTIRIFSYDAMTVFANTDNVTANSYLLIDDLAFQGTKLPTHFVSLAPQSFERWTVMDGKSYPEGWVSKGNLSFEQTAEIVSPSTDAKRGELAMKFTLKNPNTLYRLTQRYVHKGGKDPFQISLKYKLNPLDSMGIVTFGPKGPKVELLIGNALQATYKDYVFDLSHLEKDVTYEMDFVLKKGSPTTQETYLLMDDIRIGESTGLEEEEDFLLGVMYPNPTDGQVTVRSSGIGQLLLMDALGNRVMERRVANGEVISLAHLAKGLYHYEFVSGKQRKTGTLVFN